MRYAEYSASELIGDAAFRKWVQQPDAASDAFWADFLATHPEKTQEVTQAKNLLLALKDQVEAGFSTQSNEDSVLERIKQKIAKEDTTPARRLVTWRAWVAAASIFLLLGLWFWTRQPAAPQLAGKGNIENAQAALTEKVNAGNMPLLVRLGDGSSVFLKPKSKISYTEAFNAGEKREVYLSGEAFFEVARNPAKPFYVYSNELVTKVLGTSFNVQAFEDERNVTVKVSTGKVSVAVAANVRKDGQHVSAGPDSVLLLPNQQAVLSREEVRLVKSNVENPGAGKDRHVDKLFVFDSSPAAEVFEVLEKSYGLPVEYDKSLFEKCQFTADLTDEHLQDKLDIICRSIEASYQIREDRIVISGKGCN